METLTELLRRWAKLEGSRCREQDEVFDVWLGGYWVSIFSLRISAFISPSGAAVLQGALQEAAHDRRLRFRIADASNFAAKVDDYEIDLLDDECYEMQEINAPSLVHGMLWCYVEHLEELATIPQESDLAENY